MRHSIHFLNVIVMLLIFSILNINDAISQETDSSAKNSDSSLKQSWSLQFQINDNFSLSSFLGSTISAQYQYSAKNAIRFGISLHGGSEDIDVENLRMGKSKNNNSGINFILNAHYIHYPRRDKKQQFFFGFGPMAEFSHSNLEIYKTTLDKTENKNTVWGVGISGVIGIEWFVFDYISLLAEYSSSLVYSSSKKISTNSLRTTKESEFNIMDKSEIERNNFNFNPELVKFGLSIYF